MAVCSEYKSDSHTGGRRHHARGGQDRVSGAYRPSANVPPTTTAPSGTAAEVAGADMAAGDDGSVSDSAMLFGQMTDDRRRHKTNPDVAKSSATSGTASSKTSSGKIIRLLNLAPLLHLWGILQIKCV